MRILGKIIVLLGLLFLTGACQSTTKKVLLKEEVDFTLLPPPVAEDRPDVLPEDLVYKHFTISGTRFVDRNGQRAQLNGINAIELTHLRDANELKAEYFAEMKKWGAKVIRISIIPWDWLTQKESYFSMLDFAIEQAEQNNMYIMLDLHILGNVVDYIYPEGDWWAWISMAEAVEFWDIMSKRYAKNPTVAFYELANEPVTGNNYWGMNMGDSKWSDWRRFYEILVNVIRQNDKETIILAAGLDHAWTLEPILDDPVKGSNIAYTFHPYSWHGDGTWSEHWNKTVWDKRIGRIAEKYPLYATEWGYTMREDVYYDPEEHEAYLAHDRAFADQLVSYMEERNIPWIAFCFSPGWAPQLILDYENYTPTESGLHFKELLKN